MAKILTIAIIQGKWFFGVKNGEVVVPPNYADESTSAIIDSSVDLFEFDTKEEMLKELTPYNYEYVE